MHVCSECQVCKSEQGNSFWLELLVKFSPEIGKIFSCYRYAKDLQIIFVKLESEGIYIIIVADYSITITVHLCKNRL